MYYLQQKNYDALLNMLFCVYFVLYLNQFIQKINIINNLNKTNK